MKKYLIASFLLLLITLPTSVSFAQTSSSSCVSISHTMKLGSRDSLTGGDVSRLQNYLYKAGYLNSGATGYFGSLTKQAVIKFQSDNGLPATGYVGSMTEGQIHTASCNSPASGNSSSNNQNQSTVTTPSCSILITSPQVNTYFTSDTFTTVNWVNNNCDSNLSVDVSLSKTDGTGAQIISTSPVAISVATSTVSIVGKNLSNGIYYVSLLRDDTKQQIGYPVEINIAPSVQSNLGPSLSSASPTAITNSQSTTVTLYGKGFISASRVYIGGLYGTQIIPQSVATDGSSLTFVAPLVLTPTQYAVTVSNNGTTMSNAVFLTYSNANVSRYQVSTTDLAPATVGQSYWTQVYAQGFTNNYTWSISAGALPAGLSNTDGSSGYLAPMIISGTPQVAGSSTFTVKVTDTSGNTASQVLKLTVAPDPNAKSLLPALYGISPTSAATGTTITLKGARFAASKNYVLFNNRVAAGPLTSSDGITLTFTVPVTTTPNCNLYLTGGYCPYNLQVLTPGYQSVMVETINGTSNGLDFNLTP